MTDSMENQTSTAERPGAAGSDALHAALTGSVACRLDGTGVLAVSGADAASFLHGQFSSDITALRPGDTALSSYSDARGRVLGVPRLFVEADGTLLLALPRDRLDGIRQQLTKFVLRADVRIEDRSADHGCLGFAGDAAEQALCSLLPEAPRKPREGSNLPAGGTVACLPGARPRWLACGSLDALATLHRVLDGAAVGAGDEAWRLLEIEAGLPTVYQATAEHFVAQMLNLDRIGAVNFRKGCYPGQEVIARTHYLGRAKRRMHLLCSPEGAPPQPGSGVFAAGEQAGEVVDAARHPEGGSIALAVLRLDAAGSPLTLGASDGPPATASAPPYALQDET